MAGARRNGGLTLALVLELNPSVWLRHRQNVGLRNMTSPTSEVDLLPLDRNFFKKCLLESSLKLLSHPPSLNPSDHLPLELLKFEQVMGHSSQSFATRGA